MKISFLSELKKHASFSPFYHGYIFVNNTKYLLGVHVMASVSYKSTQVFPPTTTDTYFCEQYKMINLLGVHVL